MNKNVTSELISFARFPLAISVVMIHCFFSIKGWQYDHLADQGFGSNVAMEFIISTRIIILFVVALFFLISGYLFFLHLEEWNSGGWLRKMKRRFWTLLIPYLLWNTLYILYIIGPDIWDCLVYGKPWYVVKAWVDDHGGWVGLYWNAKSLGIGQVDIWGHPAHTTVPILLPFYFIRDLIVVDLFTPLFHFLLRSRDGRVSLYAIVSMVLLAFLYLTQTSFMIPGFTAEAFFFFGWGAFLSLNRFELPNVFYARRWPIAIITLVLFIAMICSGYLYSRTGRMIYPFFIVFEVMTMINLLAWMVRRSYSSPFWAKIKNGSIRWQDATFLIFALHFFILKDVFKLLNRVGGALTGFYDVRMMEMANRYPHIVIMNYLLRVVIIVAICMFVYVILRKFLPRVCGILCGR